MARAGNDVVITLPENFVTLYGNGSTDDHVSLLLCFVNQLEPVFLCEKPCRAVLCCAVPCFAVL